MQVKFKPLLQKSTADSLHTNPYPSNPTYPNISAALENSSPFIQVGLDQLGGEVWDAQAGAYKRGDEQIFYNIGSTAIPINTWYASRAARRDGFATFSVPVTSPSVVARGFYYGFGSPATRTNDVAANGGVDATGADVTQGYGAERTFRTLAAARPIRASQSQARNWNTLMACAPLMFMGAASRKTSASASEIKSHRGSTKITPGPIVARIDANSGLTYRFGTGFTYQGGSTVAQTPIVVNGGSYLPT